MVKVGIILSGGMAKGAYEIGALKCIREYFKPTDIEGISASSVGVLNAYGYSTGKLDLSEKLWSDINAGGMISSFRMLARTSFVQDTVNTLVSPADVVPHNLYSNCFDLKERKLECINLKGMDYKTLTEYMNASVSFPLFSESVKIGEKRYIDGALVDDIPVTPMTDVPYDYLIMIYFDRKSYLFENEAFDSKIIKINFYDDTLIRNFISFDSSAISQMIEIGYEKTKRILTSVFEKGTEDIPFVLSAIKKNNAYTDDSEYRVSGDVILRNINKVVKRFTK